MPSTYDNKAIKGEQLKRLAKKIKDNIATKQDTVVMTYEPATRTMVLENVSFGGTT